MWKNNAAVFLVKHDDQKFIDDIHKSTTLNDWVLRKTKHEATYEKIAKMVVEYSGYFEKEAKKYDLPVFQMDNDFTVRVKEVMQYLTK